MVKHSFILVFTALIIIFIIDRCNCQITDSVTSIYGGHSEITITSDVSFNSFKYYSIDKIKYFYVSFTDPNIVVYIKNGSIPTTTIYDYYVDEPQVTVVRAGSLSEEWFIGVYGKYSTIFTIDVFTNN